LRVAAVIYVVAFLLASISFASIRAFTPKTDEVLDIKTSLGIATIIQMPETVQSAIIGDQSAYRIEYVDKAVTIKPLRGNARTNLYLFTKDRRYNLRLQVVPQTGAYYIVYIHKHSVGIGPKWSSVNRSGSNEEMTLKLHRLGVTRDGFVLLDAILTAKKTIKPKADDIWLRAGKESVVIQSLFLSRDEIKAGQVVMIGIAVQKSDIGNRPLTLEVRKNSKVLKVEITKGDLSWK
jgi:hypothetical protein